MSAVLSQTDDLQPDGPSGSSRDEPQPGAAPVVVRRNAGLAALIGAGASAIAIAYLWRAIGSGSPLDWALCAVMAAIGATYLVHLVDARTPLLVADALGVRIRLGHQWRGLPWDAVDRVAVHPRRGLLREGRLMFAPHSLARALDGLDARGRRAAALNQKVYGAALAVPMGLTTRVSAEAGALADDLSLLVQGRSQVLLVQPERAPEPEAEPEAYLADEPEPEPEEPQQPAGPRDPRSFLGGFATLVSRVAHSHDLDEQSDEQTDDEQTDDEQTDGGSAALLPDDGRVRPIAALGDPLGPLVVDEFVTEPAYDPVIGPDLAAARTRVGLSVDELAERTRIRPHVIESIEVDDFAPCGGDFYARGHLRTLARVLGRDPEPMLALFDARYATAPINAKKVFEAELATGMTGSMRSTTGGPHWALLAGVVLALVLTWGVVRLFASEPPEVLVPVAPSLNGSAGLDGAASPGHRDGGAAVVTPGPLRIGLTGATAGSQVIVRDRAGKVVWAGEIGLGKRRTVQALPPVEVRARVGGAIQVSVRDSPRGTVGATGHPGVMTVTRAAR